MTSEIPRRIDMQRWIAAERAIYDAVQAVEAMPPDVRLTDAVLLLQAARDAVADYQDGISPKRRYVHEELADALVGKLTALIEWLKRDGRCDECQHVFSTADLTAELGDTVWGHACFGKFKGNRRKPGTARCESYRELIPSADVPPSPPQADEKGEP